MEDKTIAKGYALWLIPEKQFYENLSAEIQKISIKYKTPSFEPHITLLGNIPEEKGIVEEKTKSIAATIPNLTLKSSGFGYSENYFKSLYLEIEETDDLLKANLSARQLFKSKGGEGYQPHISLIYGAITKPEKEEIIGEMGELLQTPFKIERLSIYSTFGHVGDWFKVSDFYTFK